MEHRFLVEITSDDDLEYQFFLKLLVKAVGSEQEVIKSRIIKLGPDEVIGNKAEFIQAAQEIAKQQASKNKAEFVQALREEQGADGEVADTVCLDLFNSLYDEKQVVLVALRDAIDRLQMFSDAIESKKLKKFVDRLHKIWMDT